MMMDEKVREEKSRNKVGTRPLTSQEASIFNGLACFYHNHKRTKMGVDTSLSIKESLKR